MKDSLGEKMKALEEESDITYKIDNSSAIYVRVDGRSFHTWVKRQHFTFADKRMITAMQHAMQAVAMEFDADVAYCQSDEASFGWFAKQNPQSMHPFAGRIQKLSTVIASLYNGHFIEKLFMSGELPTIPAFDGRVVEMTDPADFQTMFYWRYLDAKRNAINGFAQHKYSHKELQGVSLADVKSKLQLDGYWTEFEKLPESYREGTFFVKPNDYNVNIPLSMFVDKETFKKAFDDRK